MYSEQKITYFAKEGDREVVYVSTLNRKLAWPDLWVPMNQTYQTFAGYTKDNTGFPLFKNHPKCSHNFYQPCTYFHLLGRDRDLQHRHAVEELEKLGFHAVDETDEVLEAICSGNKLLEDIPESEFDGFVAGAPNPDEGFTSMETKSLLMLKYLRDRPQ